MEKDCSSLRRRHDAMERPQGTTGASSHGLTFEPPPREMGPEPLWRVIYAIDVNARHARQAAERAYDIMTDPQSLRPVLDVLASTGQVTRVDLSEP